MLQPLHYTDDYTQLSKIVWHSVQEKYATHIQNIITVDIETSNGFWNKDTGKVRGFSYRKYIRNKKFRQSFDELIPVSLMWIWQVAIESFDDNIYVFIGRTEEDFYEFWNALVAAAKHGCRVLKRQTLKLYWYSHNLGFEMQGLLRNVQAKYLESDFEVFARATHKPMYARIKIDGVVNEFRCSLFLTNKTLANWCKDENLPVQKCKPINYLKIRTPETPVTDEEIQYCVADVVSMVYGLAKYKDKYGTIEDIPYTSTGEIRRVLQKVAILNPDFASLCFQNSQSYDFDTFMKLMHTYQGGYTHANKRYVNESIYAYDCSHLTGFDFASSYPSVMTNSACYPLTPFEKWDVSTFASLVAEDINHPTHAFFFKAKFRNVKTRLYNTYWSYSKAIDADSDGIMIDNGRIHYCKEFSAWMTGIDYDTFRKAYDIDSIEVEEIYVAQAGYLPTCLVEVILDCFKDKTELKGVKGAESKYTHAKQIINGIYGLMVFKMLNWIVEYTDIDKDGNKMNHKEWKKSFPTAENGGIEYYNEMLEDMKPETCHTWYAVGVYCTSMARHRIWEAIIALDKKIFYVDTDSIKGNFDDYDIQWIQDFNQHIIDESNLALAHHGFTTDRFVALTKKGAEKRLGIFELDGNPVDPENDPWTIYKSFRTLGAKRYCYEDNDGMHTTIAGLPKKAGPKVIKTVDDFTEMAEWNALDSRKVTVYYSKQQPMLWHGCDGTYYYQDVPYGICLKPTTFDMSSASELIAFCNFLFNGEVDENEMDANKIMLELP